MAQKLIIALVTLLIAVGGVLYAPIGPSFGDATEAVTGGEERYNHTLGDEFVINNMSYSTLDVETTQTVGSGVVSEETDGVFVLIEVRIENRGTEVRTASSSPMTLIDEAGTEYEVSAVDSVIDNSLTTQQLEPGESASGLVPFDLPQDAGELRLKVEDTDIISGNEVHYTEIGTL